MRPDLNPKQRAVVFLRPQGHHVVLGTAGTGKSLMAILRAEKLASDLLAEPHSVLLVTYTNALQGYLRHLNRLYRDDAEDSVVDISTYHRFATGYLRRSGIRVKAINDAERIPHIEAAATTVTGGAESLTLPDRTPEFFAKEFDWINDHAIDSLDDYLSVDRIGRRTTLGRVQREAVWRLREQYLSIRDANGWNYDWSQIAGDVRARFATDDSGPLYRHVIVDEGQDLSPEQIRSLVDIADPEGSVTFFGDYAQQLYGQRMSWRASGLELEGRRVERFRDNFRNSGPIARLAIAVSEHPEFSGDEEELVEPTQPDSVGPLPVVLRCRGRGDEVNMVARHAVEYSTDGTVGILVHNRHQVTEVLNRIRGAHGLTNVSDWEDLSGISCGTFHAAKGLEFDTVIMPFSDRSIDVDDEDSGGESPATVELKKLYVGITRARNRLLITHHELDRPPLLPEKPGLYEVGSRR